MLGLTIRIDWQDEDANGEICHTCKEIITGKKWGLFLAMDVPGEYFPEPIGKVYFCEECKGDEVQEGDKTDQ